MIRARGDPLGAKRLSNQRAFSQGIRICGAGFPRFNLSRQLEFCVNGLARCDELNGLSFAFVGEQRNDQFQVALDISAACS